MKVLILITSIMILTVSCKSYHDKEITETLNAEKTKNEKFKDFSFQVKDDIVTVSGETFDQSSKEEFVQLAKKIENVKSVTDNITIKSLCDKWVGTFYGVNDSDPFSGTRAIKLEISKSGSGYSLSVRRKEGLSTEVTPVRYEATCNGEYLYCRAQNDGDKTPGFDIIIDDYSLTFNRVTYTREASSNYFN